MHDDPEGFATAAASILTDELQWRRRSSSALRYASATLSESTLDERMRQLLSSLAARRCAVGGGRAQPACDFAARRRWST